MLTSSILILVFAIAILAILLFLWLRPRQKLRPFAQEFLVKALQLEMHGVRYENKGRQPVILLHGYAGNSRNWREMGYRLHNDGYDVWMPNLRGHGRGDHQSRAYNGGNYSFASIFTEDIPTIVEHVQKTTGREVVLVGHSLGGVAARAYLSGFKQTARGDLVLDAERARQLKIHAVKSLVLIGSPPHYHHVPKAIRAVVKQVPQLVETMLAAMPTPSRGVAPTVPDKENLIERVRQSLISKLDSTLRTANFIRGIVELENFNHDKKEFVRLLEKGTSKVPLDLVRDVNEWIKDGDVMITPKYNLSALRLIQVPLLFVCGELDWLGPYQDMLAEAEDYRERVLVRAFLVRKTSHIDLIAGERAANIIGDLIHRFIKEPEVLGDPKKHLEI